MCGDINLLEEAINNLINNAIKHSKSEKILLKTTVSNSILNMSIKDYGIGIAPEHLNRIFESSYIIDKKAVRDVGSTGLGLAIVRNIIKLHDGEISANSELNKGTEFIIKIPF